MTGEDRQRLRELRADELATDRAARAAPDDVRLEKIAVRAAADYSIAALLALPELLDDIDRLLARCPVRCPKCKGKRVVMTVVDRRPGMVTREERTCDGCGGTGGILGEPPC